MSKINEKSNEHPITDKEFDEMFNSATSNEVPEIQAVYDYADKVGWKAWQIQQAIDRIKDEIGSEDLEMSEVIEPPTLLPDEALTDEEYFMRYDSWKEGIRYFGNIVTKAEKKARKQINDYLRTKDNSIGREARASVKDWLRAYSDYADEVFKYVE